MFKVGDRIKLIDKIEYVNILTQAYQIMEIKEDNFIIMELEDKNKYMCDLIFINRYFELDLIFIRKKKLEKLCSK
jgi:hypothetical protein